MQTKTSKIVICLLAATALAGSAYFFMRSGEDPSAEEGEHEHEEIVVLTPEQIQEAGIEIRDAGSGALQTIIKAPAKVIFNQDNVAHLIPKVAGVVQEIKKNPGQKVVAGEILAVFESSEMAEAKSLYLDAFKKEQQARAKLEIEKNLHDAGVSAGQDYQNTLADTEKTLLDLELAKHKLHALGLSENEITGIANERNANLRHYYLRSPMRGVIIAKDITKGEFLDTTHEVFAIADISTLWVEIGVFPQDAKLLKEGLTVHIDCPGEVPFEAKVVSISPMIDPETSVIRVIAELDNKDNRWQPNSYVCAQIRGKSETANLVVPKDAIQKVEGHDCLFVVTEKGFEVRQVIIGRCDGRTTEVISGLNEGERYAAKNTFILKADHGKDEAQHMD